MRIAITREVSPNIAQCELTYLAREPIDYERAREQHRLYVDTLADLGCEIVRLSADASLPDSVFVEDTAVVLDEIAIVTRPGAESRRDEPRAVSAILGRFTDLASIAEPATLDGGDVLRVDRTLYVGISTRTNEAAVSQLQQFARGYEVVPVEFGGCLHLKTAVTVVGPRTLLINPDCVSHDRFGDVSFIDVDPSEPFAANALLLGDRVIVDGAHFRTREKLEALGLRVVPVDLSELAKAEGGVTCCSVIVER